MGITSERKIVMQGKARDASAFSQNRRRRLDKSGFMEKLFDGTIEPHVAARERGLWYQL
jgi:hypothetical protein